jgi:hypothetical protein
VKKLKSILAILLILCTLAPMVALAEKPSTNNYRSLTNLINDRFVKAGYSYTKTRANYASQRVYEAIDKGYTSGVKRWYGSSAVTIVYIVNVYTVQSGTLSGVAEKLFNKAKGEAVNYRYFGTALKVVGSQLYFGVSYQK